MERSLSAATSGHDRESAGADSDHLEIRLWLRLLTCTTLIEREVRARLGRKFDITLSRFDVLAQLERADNGLTMGQLSHRMMVTQGNVTGLVDRLVTDGLEERKAIDGDRRVHLIRLTTTGRSYFEELAAVHHGWICDMFAGLNAADTNRLFKLLAQVKTSVTAESENEMEDGPTEEKAA
jgi:DNA-binding MarR family transcriptional regulator